MKRLLTLVLIAIATMALAQTYETPALSPGDIVDWANRGGFIASDTAAPTAAVATGALYIDATDATAPKLWRYDGDNWQQLSGADSQFVIDHIETTVNPHGESMKVAEEIQIGDPAEDPWSYIDSPATGTIRINDVLLLKPLGVAPDAVEGGVYYNTNGNFYGSNGSTWFLLN